MVRHESKRLAKIFDELRSGKRVAEINEDRDHYDKEREKKKERGRESELIVKRVLSSLWYVREVLQLSEQRGHDRNAHDLEVFLGYDACSSLLATQLVIPNGAVFVQVKSSDAGVEIFHEETRRYIERYSINLTLEEYYLSKKLVVLNGQTSPEIIQNSFLQQITAMNILQGRSL